MIRLKALGQSTIEVGDVRILPEQPYLFAIALYLIVERGKRIPRQALVDLIWPNVRDEKHARQRFRQALLRLRESGVPIVGDNGTLLLDKTAAQADFDGLASPEAIRPGQSLEFLPHYAPRISDRFLDWVETQRSRVHARLQSVFLLRMQQARSRGDWAEVDAVAAECLRLDPYNEEAVMAHAECAAMRGSKREALSILDGYMEALGSHVGTIGLPAKILRTRIAERLTDKRYAMISEQYFVGRETSMELLQGLLREAQRGSGSAALIWGEPGIGKSRLVQELVQVAALEGARVVSTKCHPTDAGRPLSAFADLVPVLKTLPGALGCSAQTLSLLHRLTDRNKGETFPTLEAGDAAFLAATIRRAVFDIVDAVADEGSLVMVIEDVHWLDGPSWAILSAMVEWSTTRTLLILMTSRTSHVTESKVGDPDRGFHRHRLLPLMDPDSAALIEKLVNNDSTPLPIPVRQWSVASAEGNPFYLRELVRHWLETGQSFGVPQSLAELIEGRLNRLSSLGLRVLQLCTAFGKHSTFERLEKSTGYQNHVLLDAIEELSSAAMLAGDKLGIQVKHDLLATATLTRLSGPALRLVHRQVAAVLEAEIREQPTASLMWDCLEHWQCAGETERALATVRLCAKHLHAVGQLQEAIELHEKALGICVAGDERVETLLGLAGALKAAERWLRLSEVVSELQRVVSEKPRKGDVHDQLDLLQAEVEWRLRVGLEGALGRLVSFASDKSKSSAHRLAAVHLAMIQCAEQGQRESALSLLGVVDQLESTANQPALVAHIRMIFHADYGDMDVAVEQAKALLGLAAKSAQPSSLSRTNSNLAFFFRRTGLMTEAKRLLGENLAFAVEHELAGLAALTALQLALCALQEEDFGAAERWHAQAGEYMHGLDERIFVDNYSYIAARIGLHCGDPKPAQHFVATSVQHAVGMSFRFRQSTEAIRCLAQLAANQPISREQVEAMEEEFHCYCHLGQQDFFALTLHAGLMALGESARATQMLSGYVTRTRRDRSPLPPSLLRALEANSPS